MALQAVLNTFQGGWGLGIPFTASEPQSLPTKQGVRRSENRLMRSQMQSKSLDEQPIPELTSETQLRTQGETPETSSGRVVAVEVVEEVVVCAEARAPERRSVKTKVISMVKRVIRGRWGQ